MNLINNMQQLNENKTEQTNNFNIYKLGLNYFGKIPEITNTNIKTKKIHNILLCDSSGSMSSYWSKVANEWNKLVEKLDGTVSIILFSDRVYKYGGKTLPIHMVESGGTDIIKGLKELEIQIKSNSLKDLIRVFFITDGSDSNYQTFQTRFDKVINEYYKPINEVEFFLLGLTGNFPVFISQAIRSKIHTGRIGIPNLFWSQTCSIDEISNEFENMSNYNKIANKFILPEDCMGLSAPFTDPTNTFYTGDWVSFDVETLDKLTVLNGVSNLYQIEIKELFQFDEILEMFEQWIKILQTQCIKLGSDTKTISQIAKITSDNMKEFYNLFINSQLIIKPTQSLTFTERIRKNY